ncbi:MAG: OmpA family protein, partial [Candidatus Fibromonas sp.]|nr:OmpA family protein [Candidatus Fibromonas sp.]
GHTDNLGKAVTNQKLSENRAKAVVSYLATKGVKMNRMKAVGYGPSLPIADNATEEGRELNRRIEMIRIDK